MTISTISTVFYDQKQDTFAKEPISDLPKKTARQIQNMDFPIVGSKIKVVVESKTIRSTICGKFGFRVFGTFLLMGITRSDMGSFAKVSYFWSQNTVLIVEIVIFYFGVLSHTPTREPMSENRKNAFVQMCRCPN